MNNFASFTCPGCNTHYTMRIAGAMPTVPVVPQLPRPDITFATILEDRAGEAHIRAHPAGGWILIHHDHPARWIKTDGTIEEIKP